MYPFVSILPSNSYQVTLYGALLITGDIVAHILSTGAVLCFLFCFSDSGPRERKKLQLKPRSVPVEVNKPEPAAAAAPQASQPAPKSSSSIFGGARPVDTAAREREIEARLARQREEEERRQIRDREPFQDRCVETVGRVTSHCARLGGKDMLGDRRV